MSKVGAQHAKRRSSAASVKDPAAWHTDDGTLQVQPGRLPAPEGVLSVNHVQVLDGGSVLSIVFGQADVRARRLIGALHLTFPADRFREALRSNDFDRSLAEYASRNPLVDVPAELALPDRTVFEHAALVALAQTDVATEARFFDVSPVGLHNAGPVVEVIRPIVCVMMHTSLAFRLCELVGVAR